jgi:hypothetical protein
LAYRRYKNLHPVSKLAISPFCDLEDAIKTGEQDNVAVAVNKATQKTAHLF